MKQLLYATVFLTTCLVFKCSRAHTIAQSSHWFPSLLERHSSALVGKWSTPPTTTIGTSTRSPDAPLLGNGDMGITVTASLYDRNETVIGEPRNKETWVTYSVGLNQLVAWGWTEDSDNNTINFTQNYPWLQTLGGVQLGFPATSPFSSINTTFKANQSIFDANVVVQFTSADGRSQFTATSIVDYDTNTLVTDVTFNNAPNATQTGPSSYDLTISTFAFNIFQIWHWNTTAGCLTLDATPKPAANCTYNNVNTDLDSSHPNVMSGDWVTRLVFGDGTYPVWAALMTKTVARDYIITDVVTDGVSNINTTIRVATNQTVTILSRALTNLDVAGIDWSANERQYPAWGYPTTGLVNPIQSLATLMSAQNRFSTEQLKASHTQHWTIFWSAQQEGALISLPNDMRIERYWYAHTYLMAMAGKVGAPTPGLWGPWIYNDKSSWRGIATWNYNQEAAWWGMYASDRFDIVNYQYSIIMQYLPQAKINAKQWGNCSNAIKWPVSTSPLGFSGRLGSGGDLGSKYVASYVFLNLITHYEYTLDKQFLVDKLYPNLKLLVNWWRCWMRKQTFCDGNYRYVDWYDCAWEQCNTGNNQPMNAFNPITGLSMVRRIIASTIRFSIHLNTDQDERVGWQDMLDHLSVYPTFTLVNSSTFGTQVIYSFAEDSIYVNTSLAQSDASHNVSNYPYGWGNNNSYPTGAPTKFINIYPVWPTATVTTHSNLQQVKIALSTINFMNNNGSTFAQINNFPLAFPAAVRAGYPITLIMSQFLPLLSIKSHGYNETESQYSLLNLFHAEGSGGFMENSGAMMAVNEMLVQGHEYAVSLFPSWPTGHCASFKNIRVPNAFKISATYSGITITYVSVHSLKGGKFAIFHPWAESQTTKEIRAFQRAGLAMPNNIATYIEKGTYDVSCNIRVFTINNVTGSRIGELSQSLLTWHTMAPNVNVDTMHLVGGWDNVVSNHSIWVEFDTMARSSYEIALDISICNNTYS